MPLLAWTGIILGAVCLLVHQSMVHRLPRRARILGSFFSCGLLFGSLNYGLGVKLDRDGEAFKASLAHGTRR